MGCCPSRSDGWNTAARAVGKKRLKRPAWKSEQPMSPDDLQAKRDEFWDTAVHYGGDKIIWDALKAAIEQSDPATAFLILDSAGISYQNNDLHVCYDERGRKYELPDYVLAAPTNLQRNSTKTDAQQVELMSRD